MKIQKKVNLMQKGWNNWAQTSDNSFAAVGRPLNDYEITNLIEDIRNKLTLNHEDILLDVGCGSGIFISGLNKFVKKAIGVDFSDQMILLAKENTQNIEFCVSQSDSLPFADNSFNKIYVIVFSIILKILIMQKEP